MGEGYIGVRGRGVNARDWVLVAVLKRLQVGVLAAWSGNRGICDAGAGTLMMRRLWMQLQSLRRARRDVALVRHANARARDDDDSDLGEAGVDGGDSRGGWQ